MRFILKAYTVVLILLMHAICVFSQNIRLVMDHLAKQLEAYTIQKNQTSVYLATSKDIYVKGEDLWFNAFILNARELNLSTLDKTIYLLLQQKESDSTVWLEMYSITNGLSAGHVYLPQTLPEGDYLLKAYTAHSFFSNQPYFYAVAPIKVVKEPRAIIRNYAEEREAPVKKTAIQFSLFPEGGNLVAGMQNQVGFKAVNKEGKPVTVRGTLLKGNEPVLRFTSVYAGMGSFLFTPEKTQHIV